MFPSKNHDFPLTNDGFIDDHSHAYDDDAAAAGAGAADAAADAAVDVSPSRNPQRSMCLVMFHNVVDTPARRQSSI